MRFMLTTGLALHGLIHLIGFVVPFGLAVIDGYPRVTTAVGGRLELGEAGAKALGVGWLVGCVAFLVASVGVGTSATWAGGWLTTAAAFSILLCIAGLPASAAGIGVNLVIVAAVLVARNAGVRLGRDR